MKARRKIDQPPHAVSDTAVPPHADAAGQPVHASDPLLGRAGPVSVSPPIATSKPLRGGVEPSSANRKPPTANREPSSSSMVKGLDLQRGIDHLMAAHKALDAMGIDFTGVNTARAELIKAAQCLRDAGAALIGGKAP